MATNLPVLLKLELDMVVIIHSKRAIKLVGVAVAVAVNGMIVERAGPPIFLEALLAVEVHNRGSMTGTHVV